MTHRCSILLVDDETSLRISLSRIFVNAGYAVQSAGSLDQARELICGGEHFYLVVLDLKYPDGQAMELLPLIQCQEPAPRVVILTATPLEASTFDLVSDGVDAYLEKPCDPEEIISTVHELLA
jgi:DNA-binding NtrC family response regulator